MKKAVIKPGKPGYAFKNGLFGVNAEITRKGYFGGLSAQMINNRKFFAGDTAPSGWDCDSFEYITNRRDESLCESNFVILRGGSMRQTSEFIALKAGEKYGAKAWVKALSDNAFVTIGVSGAEKRFSVPQSEKPYIELSFEFDGAETDNGTFTVKTEGDIAVFEVSLLISDNFYGMRRDVIDALKYISPSSLRFPGGCAADHFDWKQSLKAPEFRVPAHGGDKWFLFRDTYNQDCLDIGINEFMMLCKELGAEPEYTVSLLLSDGEDAADIVEYCNGDTDTKYGALRQRIGFDKFNVKLWYIGNEAYFFGREYQKDGALAAKRTDYLIAAMKKADPSIVPVVGLTWAKDFQIWNYDFVAACESEYEYVSFHDYIGMLSDPSQGHNGMATAEMLESNLQNGESYGLEFYKNGLYPDRFDKIKVCADEWNYSWGQDSNNALFFSNALQFHFFAKSGEKYHIERAAFFMPVNEGMITVKGAECKTESTGEFFHFMKGHKDGVICACDTDDPLDVLCTRHGEKLFMSVINRHAEPQKISVDGYEIASVTQIAVKDYGFDSNDFEIIHGGDMLYGHSVMFMTLTKKG